MSEATRRRDLGGRAAVGQRMDEALLWQQIEDQAERQPLLTIGEARAAVALLRREGSPAADELAARIARRLPAK
ncbi:hypothetical protein [Streptomyces hygroscopicus]|uniref:hypothetical protein n=1 Tax=Streptomyces hygroscopicus TaxID=1912 RepID=UPI003682A41A